MEYSNFYDLAKYGNENWKGAYSEKDVACNAYDYKLEFDESKKVGKPTHIISELMKLLDEDGSEEAMWFLNDIRWELKLPFEE